MNHLKPQDYAGETYYVYKHKDKVLGEIYKIFPFNADIFHAHWEMLQVLKDIKEQKERNKSYAV